MPRLFGFSLALALCGTSLPAFAQQHGPARPELLLREVVQGMPRGDKQEVRILTANLAPGDATPFHTHRNPVAVYARGRLHARARRARAGRGQGRPGDA